MADSATSDARGPRHAAQADRHRQTVTFLFADIEGSTRLVRRLAERYEHVLTTYRHILRTAVADERGWEVDAEGDGLFAAFPSGGCAIAAAVAAQRELDEVGWPDGVSVKVRMGIHTGEAIRSEEGYVGLDVHRAARIGAAAHGGQILLSQTTRELVVQSLPDQVALRDIGQHRLKDLTEPERLYQVEAAGLATTFPPPRTLDATPNNLPTQLTSFIGREREVVEVAALLPRTRLVTLTGPGGTGKTRLSLQVAARVADRYPDGVFFVPLAPVRDGTLVAPAILHALGVTESGQQSPLDGLLQHLADRRVLLVLDNFEQILDAADVVSNVLAGAAGVGVLVTSRSALHLQGEQEFPVPPLQVPDLRRLPDVDQLSQFEAVALFIQRAQAVRPDFVVTNENAPSIAELCARLDGLPLAIELAAARVKLLPPQAILARLGKALDLLAVTGGDRPDRQRTLRGAIAWSFDLLAPPVQQLFTRLAVFLGGWDFETAEVVAEPGELGVDLFDGTAELVDHSLVRQLEADGEPRFSMLETIREFATDRLAASGEEEMLARRHAQVFLARVEACVPDLMGERRASVLDRLEGDHGNFRAALDRMAQLGEVATVLRLAAALWRFWQMRGHLPEARERLDHALGLPHGPAHQRERILALEGAGGVAYWQSDFQAARRYYGQALELAQAGDDPAAEANALYNLSFAHTFSEEREQAQKLLGESLAIYRRIDDKRGVANVLWAGGYSLVSSGEVQRGMAEVAESLALYRELGDLFGVGWALYNLATAQLRDGHPEVARPLLEESLDIFLDAQDISGIVLHLDMLAELTAAEGDLRAAMRLAGASKVLAAQSGATLADAAREFEERTLWEDQLKAHPELADAWEEGQAMSVEEAVAFLREHAAS